MDRVQQARAKRTLWPLHRNRDNEHVRAMEQTIRNAVNKRAIGLKKLSAGLPYVFSLANLQWNNQTREKSNDAVVSESDDFIRLGNEHFANEMKLV